MAGTISMTPDTMRQRAGQTDKQAESMQGLINSMDNLLKTLKGEWKGEAMVGYEDRYNRIRPSLNNAKELLDEIAHNLRKTAEILERTDRDIGNQFKAK